MTRRLRGLLTAVVLVALDATNAAAYRTGADQAETAGTARVRWSTGTIPMSLSSDGCPGIALTTVEQSVLASMARWNQLECGSLDFRYQGTTNSLTNGDGVNSIEWHAYQWTSFGFPADSAGTTDLVYRRNGSGAWEIVEADVHLNAASLTWSPTAGAQGTTERSLESVVTHELGHVLGLLHPCEPGGADSAPDCATSTAFAATTMYPLYTGPAQSVLAADDIAGACFLYPAAPCAMTCASGQACVGGTCTDTCGGQVCGLGETCVGGACVEPCAVLGCSNVVSCQTSSECPRGQSCWLGACIPTVGQMGDPCQTGAECATGVCDQGTCTRYCTGACQTGYACDGRVCRPSLGTFGSACASGDACASGVCILGSKGTDECSRRCDGANLPCPSSATCEAVGSEMVCVPKAATGCGVSPTTPSAGSWWIWGGLLAVVVMRKRMRSR